MGRNSLNDLVTGKIPASQPAWESPAARTKLCFSSAAYGVPHLSPTDGPAIQPSRVLSQLPPEEARSCRCHRMVLHPLREHATLPIKPHPELILRHTHWEGRQSPTQHCSSALAAGKGSHPLQSSFAPHSSPQKASLFHENKSKD